MNTNLALQRVQEKTSAFVLILLSGVLASGCQHKVAEVKPAVVTPAWLTAPPSQDGNSLYGSGVGKTREEAIEAALSDVAAKLGTEIQATTKLTTIHASSAYRYTQEETQQTIESSIRKITLNQYELVALQALGYQRFAALVRSDKALLAHSLQRELDQQLRQYRTALKALSSIGFRRVLFFEKEQQGLATFSNNLAALVTLEPLREVGLYQDYLHEVRASLEASRQQTIFSIQGPEIPDYVRKALTNKLLQAGFMVTQSPSEATDQITVKTNLNQDWAYDFVVLRETIEMNTAEDGTLIGGVLFVVKGQGLTTKQARQQLFSALNTRFEQSSLEVSLGIHQ
ncbi:LPP20 family lipoprotein [Thiomicrorhabdus cannonii]|uniref:LPP20 family lipoprotein n=1 Tax=Thiomicrorhabdus cannonii TaxID=2748011 RepID=UPI0015C19B2B|nr:LPP20 family lipoprotein [Thiomicrorhabdus cannonii]